MRQPDTHLLAVSDLRVTFHQNPPIEAVRGVSLDVKRAEAIGIVGESGSGKSVTVLSVLGLLQGQAAIVEGSAVFEGSPLIGASSGNLRSIRGNRIGFVFQDPLASLDPLYRIGSQLVEAYTTHVDASRTQAHARTLDLLEQVGIANPSRVARLYPHEISGGMRQRVMIAAALSCEPDLLIADEPTTALDVTIQAQILELLSSLRRDRGMALIMITHDLAVASQAVDRIYVMYGGRVVEEGPRELVLSTPRHPYTAGLLLSAPRMEHTRATDVHPIPGEPLAATEHVPGCPFAPRCEWALERCFTEPQTLGATSLETTHRVACWRADELTASLAARGRMK